MDNTSIRVLLHPVAFAYPVFIVFLEYVNNPVPESYLRVFFLVLFLVQLLCLNQETDGILRVIQGGSSRDGQ